MALIVDFTDQRVYLNTGRFLNNFKSEQLWATAVRYADLDSCRLRRLRDAVHGW
jgi:hypothetical protein